jgi:aerobic C4-dicarboxylate transport protein
VAAPSAAAAKRLYAAVVAGIVAGIALGVAAPDFAVELKPLGDGFVRLVKMIIAPIIFTTVVVGIAGMRDVKALGRVGWKAILYFEVVTTFALLIGLGVVHAVRPGAGMHVDPAALDARAVEAYRSSARAAHEQGGGLAQAALAVIPDSAVGAFARGEILPVLFLAVVFGTAVAARGEAGRGTVRVVEELGKTLFGIVRIIMYAAPLGALGAMAFAVGKFGPEALSRLALLMVAFYVTALLFVLVVLGAIARAAGVSILRFLRYIGDEILLVLGTSSSEAALPQLMAKLEAMGCPRAVVGLVVPTGYSFNLDGTSIYLTMAAVFIAQATDTPLALGDELLIIGVLLLTSKGAAAVTGGGFVTLAGTLESTGRIPVAGLALLLGIDRFMSEARAIVNLIGNGVAAVFISWWEGGLDAARVREALYGEPAREPRAPAPAAPAPTGAGAGSAERTGAHES